MILWIASFPRSGNTLLRLICNQVFDIKTYSKHNDIHDIGADRQTSDLVGHKFIEKNWAETYLKMQRQDQYYLVKTHDPPENESKAIYIVRDGRASIVSLFHYLKDFTNREYTLADVILGFTPAGSWSAHLDAWDPFNRANTLLLRYERLLDRPQEEIERLSEFLGHKPIHPWNNDFEYYHSINPKFFRSGDTSKNISEIDKDELKLFWLYHGDWMHALGYECDYAATVIDRRRIREITGYAYKKIQSEIYSLEAEKTKLSQRIEKMSNTLSWKLTAPLRNSRLAKVIPKKFKT